MTDNTPPGNKKSYGNIWLILFLMAAGYLVWDKFIDKPTLNSSDVGVNNAIYDREIGEVNSFEKAYNPNAPGPPTPNKPPSPPRIPESGIISPNNSVQPSYDINSKPTLAPDDNLNNSEGEILIDLGTLDLREKSDSKND